MPVVEGQDTDKILIDLAKECGVQMCRNDISISHRLQSRNGAKPPPIVVRFVRREKKVEIMRAKKNLKAKSKRVLH